MQYPWRVLVGHESRSGPNREIISFFVSASKAHRFPYARLAQTPISLVAIILDLDVKSGGFIHESLPPPNIAIRTPSGGAHAFWLLETPVARHRKARPGPIRYFKYIEAFHKEICRAEPSFSGLARNPSHPDNQTEHVHDHLYSLKELAAPIPLDWKPEISRSRFVLPEGAGRNTTLFTIGNQFFRKTPTPTNFSSLSNWRMTFAFRTIRFPIPKSRPSSQASRSVTSKGFISFRTGSENIRPN